MTAFFVGGGVLLALAHEYFDFGCYCLCVFSRWGKHIREIKIGAIWPGQVCPGYVWEPTGAILQKCRTKVSIEDEVGDVRWLFHGYHVAGVFDLDEGGPGL